jgi:hypothetical protein
MPLLPMNVWDMLEAAMATDSTPAPPAGQADTEIPTDAPPSEPAPSRRARRRAPVA